MDPALHLALRLPLAALLAAAAWHKLSDPAAFAVSVEGYDLVGPAPSRWIARILPPLEAGLAGALAMALPLAGVAAAALMLAYAAAIAINLGRGRRDIDCGCFGPGRRASLGPGLVARNLLLAALLAATALPSGNRDLGWLDVATVVGSSLVLVLCWQAAEAMMVLAPRLASIRRVRA